MTAEEKWTLLKALYLVVRKGMLIGMKISLLEGRIAPVMAFLRALRTESLMVILMG